MSTQVKSPPPKFFGGKRSSLRGSGEKAKNFKASCTRLIKHLKIFRWRIAVVVFFAICSTLFSTIGPKLLSYATDELASGILRIMDGSGGIDFFYIHEILFLLFFLYVTSAVFSLAMSYLVSGLTSDVVHGLREQLSLKINRLPLSYFNKTNHGDLLSRITNDVDTLGQAFNQSITQIITSIITITSIIIIMLSISPQLTVVALCILPVSLLLVSFITKKSQHYYNEQREILGAVNGHVEEMYSGHLVIKAFNGEEASITKFNEQNDKLFLASWKADFRSGIMLPLIHLVGNLSYVAVCILGAWLTTKGIITIGGIQAFIQYVRSLGHPVAAVANITGNLQQMIAASERIFFFLDEAEEDRPAPLFTTTQVNITGNVTFQHVQFSYDTDRPVIHDFNASIKAGQQVAIVGPTGAGKTTIVKLLMRFYDIDSGNIFIDGYDISAFDRHDLRSQFSMVLQDIWLYNGSIMDNIRYGRPDATDQEVIASAKAAQIDYFIRTLPDGYNMQINEESTNISQGQKQLLTIARAILADAKILIFDEATSSVDTRTELLLQKAMHNMLKGRTSFIIAHRLSTIRKADLILCMNEGNIVEQGTHEELMKLNGFYTRLYNSQFEQIAV